MNGCTLVSGEGHSFLNATLANLHVRSSLKRLDFSNSPWLQEDDALAKFFEIIKQTRFLEQLHVGESNLECAAVKKILSVILESPCFNTISELMMTACQWNDREVAELFLKVLATVPSLKEVNICKKLSSESRFLCCVRKGKAFIKLDYHGDKIEMKRSADVKFDEVDIL